MNGTTSQQGTERFPKFHDGPSYSQDATHFHGRFMTYDTDQGLVGAGILALTFAIDAPVSQVWPHFKDFNGWQNEYGHFYSSPWDAREGGTVVLSATPGGPGRYPEGYHVVRVVPEHLIVIQQPVPRDGSNGGLSPGFHSFTLAEFGGRTVVTGLMQHGHRMMGASEDEVLELWRGAVPEWLAKWRDVFIPTLETLVAQGAGPAGG